VIPTSSVYAFTIACLLLVPIPGPSVLFVISRAVVHGRRAALATVLGNAAGLYVQVVAVALGLGVVIERSAAAYTAIKLLGAGYLVWLGVRTFRARRSLAATLDVGASSKTDRRILRDGFVVGVTNPKSAVFFAAILPGFTDPSAGRVPLQMLVLGLIFVVIALVCDAVWGLLAGTARERFVSSPRRLEAIGGAGGVVLVGLGVGLAVTGRKP